MNERTKEIASQVLNELVPQTWTKLGYDKIKEIQFRTAYLIVRECRDIVSKTRDQAIESEWNVDEAMSTAMYNIEEHFEV